QVRRVPDQVGGQFVEDRVVLDGFHGQPGADQVAHSPVVRGIRRVPDGPGGVQDPAQVGDQTVQVAVHGEPATEVVYRRPQPGRVLDAAPVVPHGRMLGPQVQ